MQPDVELTPAGQQVWTAQYLASLGGGGVPAMDTFLAASRPAGFASQNVPMRVPNTNSVVYMGKAYSNGEFQASYPVLWRALRNKSDKDAAREEEQLMLSNSPFVFRPASGALQVKQGWEYQSVPGGGKSKAKPGYNEGGWSQPEQRLLSTVPSSGFPADIWNQIGWPLLKVGSALPIGVASDIVSAESETVQSRVGGTSPRFTEMFPNFSKVMDALTGRGLVGDTGKPMLNPTVNAVMGDLGAVGVTAADLVGMVALAKKLGPLGTTAVSNAISRYMQNKGIYARLEDIEQAITHSFNTERSGVKLSDAGDVVPNAVDLFKKPSAPVPTVSQTQAIMDANPRPATPTIPQESAPGHIPMNVPSVPQVPSNVPSLPNSPTVPEGGVVPATPMITPIKVEIDQNSLNELLAQMFGKGVAAGMFSALTHMQRNDPSITNVVVEGQKGGGGSAVPLMRDRVGKLKPKKTVLRQFKRKRKVTSATVGEEDLAKQNRLRRTED